MNYLLPRVFEKDVKESTESIHLCLLCNGMNRVQSNLYEENKAELSLGYHPLHFFLIDRPVVTNEDLQLNFVFNTSEEK